MVAAEGLELLSLGATGSRDKALTEVCRHPQGTWIRNHLLRSVVERISKGENREGAPPGPERL